MSAKWIIQYKLYFRQTLILQTCSVQIQEITAYNV